MYECQFCGNAFQEPTDVGACPACGGPKPVRLTEPEVAEKIVTKYVYINYGPTGGYYSNPSPTISEWAYSTFGFKVVTSLIITIALILITSFLYWVSYRADAPKNTDPIYQNILPTAVATATTHIEESNSWTSTVWLGNQEAANLREQEQVIHLAYLDRGQAHYTNQSIVFEPSVWQKNKPLGATGFTVNGTGFEINLNGNSYHLNIYQPFVIGNQPNSIYLVDSTDQIWKTDLENITLVDLTTAQNSLSVKINPNPRLSPTY